MAIFTTPNAVAQAALTTLGYPPTFAGVRAAQADAGLPVTGIVDVATLAALQAGAVNGRRRRGVGDVTDALTDDGALRLANAYNTFPDPSDAARALQWLLLERDGKGPLALADRVILVAMKSQAVVGINPPRPPGSGFRPAPPTGRRPAPPPSPLVTWRPSPPRPRAVLPPAIPQWRPPPPAPPAPPVAFDQGRLDRERGRRAREEARRLADAAAAQQQPQQYGPPASYAPVPPLATLPPGTQTPFMDPTFGDPSFAQPQVTFQPTSFDASYVDPYDTTQSTYNPALSDLERERIRREHSEAVRRASEESARLRAQQTAHERATQDEAERLRQAHDDHVLRSRTEAARLDRSIALARQAPARPQPAARPAPAAARPQLRAVR
jgi:hypothetical protein